MVTVTIPKDEYLSLKKQANLYTRFASQFFEIAFMDSPSQIVNDFKATKLYSKEFLDDLGDGLENLFNSKEWKSR